MLQERLEYLRQKHSSSNSEQTLQSVETPKIGESKNPVEDVDTLREKTPDQEDTLRLHHKVTNSNLPTQKTQYPLVNHEELQKQLDTLIKGDNGLPLQLWISTVEKRIYELAQEHGWDLPLVLKTRQFLDAALRVRGPRIIGNLLNAYHGHETELTIFSNMSSNATENQKKLNKIANIGVSLAQFGSEALYFTKITVNEIQLEGRIALLSYGLDEILSDPRATQVFINYLNCDISETITYLTSGYHLDKDITTELELINQRLEALRTAKISPSPFDFDTVANAALVASAVRTLEKKNAKNLSRIVSTEASIANYKNKAKAMAAERSARAYFWTEQGKKWAGIVHNAFNAPLTTFGGGLGGLVRGIISFAGEIVSGVGEGANDALPDIGNGVGKIGSGVVNSGEQIVKGFKEGRDRYKDR